MPCQLSNTTLRNLAKTCCELVFMICLAKYILLNSVKSNDDAKDFVQSQMHCSTLFDSFNDFCCTSDILGPLMCKLKLNCAAVADNITVEHLCYSDHSIKFYLSVLFSMCLNHGFVSKACLDTLLVPIVNFT